MSTCTHAPRVGLATTRVLTVAALLLSFSGCATTPRAPTSRIDLPGATGDRTRDRQATADAFERVGPGGTIAFGAGTYLVGGEGLVLTTPGVVLQGHPDGTTLQGCTTEEGATFESGEFSEVCNGFVLSAEAQQVVGLRFEAFFLALHIREPSAEERGERPVPFTGGHVIRGNTFQDNFSLQIELDADSAVWVRGNEFRNTWHAVAALGRNIQIVDNDISVPNPERGVYGFPGGAIGIRPDENGVCQSFVVERNRIDGHLEGVMVAVLPQDTPGAACSDIVVRANEITMRPVFFPTEAPSTGFWIPEQAGKLSIGPAIRLLNAQPLVGEGVLEWPERWMPEDGWPPEFSEARLSDIVVEGNRITGAVGVAVEVVNVSDSRIVDNEIEVRPASTPEEREGLALGGNAVPGIWVELGLVDEVNGTPVWVSEGSEGVIVQNRQ